VKNRLALSEHGGRSFYGNKRRFGIGDGPELMATSRRNEVFEVHPFGSGCSERLKILPSGSLNQATFAPVGEVQMPNAS
jgi:hypothetical protein